MKKLASASFQTEYIKDPEPGKDGKDAVSIVVSPEAILHKIGTSPYHKVYVDVYDGAEHLKYGDFTCSTLSETILGNMATWTFLTDSDNRFYYRITVKPAMSGTLTVPFTVTYKGVTYNRSFSITTVKDGDKGGPGDDGLNGVYIPPPMEYDSYPIDYEFKSGNLDANPPETRLDVVLRKTDVGTLRPYRCIKSDDGYYYDPGNDGPEKDTEHWAPFEITGYRSIATDLMLARNARIEFLSGQTIIIGDDKGVWGYFGVPTSDGGDIILTGHTQEYDTKIAAGENVEYSPQYSTFALNQYGEARWGKKGGRRIEVNPKDASVRIYDDDGTLRTTLTGARKDLSSAIPGGSADTALANGLAVDEYATSTTTETLVVIPELGSKAAAHGSALVKIPQLKLTATAGAITPSGSSGSSGDSETLQKFPQTSLDVTVTVYTKSGGTDTVRFQRSYSVRASAPTSYEQADEKTETRTIAPETVTVPIEKDHSLRVEVRIGAEVIRNNGSWNVVSQKTGDGGSSDTSDKFGGSFVYRMRQCIYATNGIFLSSDSENYFYIAFDENDKLVFGCKINGVEKELKDKPSS